MPSPPVDPDRWLSVHEVASHLGVSRETVYAWIKNKAMPAHRVGRHWKFKKHEVDKWVRHDGAADSGDGNEHRSLSVV
ncbi:MAG: helix-turn-helix domain-containing protein [Deltaproteobacteria bacterium]|nr:helix-turn-helix domain-containing protein [Deltaproteobacteria bacterium]